MTVNPRLSRRDKGAQAPERDFEKVSWTPPVCGPMTPRQEIETTTSKKSANGSRVNLKSVTWTVCHRTMTSWGNTDSVNLPDSKSGSLETSTPLMQEYTIGYLGVNGHAGLDCSRSEQLKVETMKQQTQKGSGINSDSNEALGQPHSNAAV